REASEAGRRQCELVGSGQYQIPPPPSDTLPPWILGRVTDAGSGDPLPAAQVYLTLGRHGALTSASGCFRFELPREVVGERVEVRTDYLGYHSRSDTIRVAPAGNLFLVELERAPIQLDIGGDVHPGSTRSLDSTTAAPRPRPVRHGVPGEGLRSPGDVEPTLRSLHRCTRLVDGIQSTHPDSWAAVLGRVEDRADGSPIHRAQITSTTVPTTVTTWADGCFLLEFPDSLIGRSVPFEVEAIDYHPSVDSLVVPDGLAMRRVELNRALAPLPCWEAARCADSTAPAARTRAERSVDEADRMLARRDFGRLLEEARAECSTAIRELMADTLSRPDDPPMLLGRVTERGHRVQHYPVIVEGVSEPLWTRGNGCFNLRATLPDSLVGRRIEILFNQIGYLARAVGLVVGPGSNVIDVPLRAVALTMCGSIEGSCDPPSRSPEAPRVRAWEPRPVVTAPPAPGSVVLMGRVLDDVTGVSLSGVVVSVDDRGESTLSDSSGGFRLFLPPSDSRTEATVRAQYDGYWSASSRVALVAQSAEVDLRIRPAPHTDADGPRSGGCLTVHRLEALSMDRAPRGEAPFVSGTVTECGASTPLEGATAHMDDLGLAAVGDPRGYFRIDLQSEHVGRAARLTVRAPGHVATSVRFLIGSGGNVLMLALPVHRPGPMEACGADPGPCAADGVADTSLPLLAGTLVDARTGTPISDVPTFLDSTRLRPHATGGGGYLVHLPKGSVGTAVPVRFEHPLYETLTEHRTILPGENRLDRALTSIADRIEDYAANARRECVERAVSRYAYVRGSGPPVLVGRVEDPTSRQGLPHTQIWIEGQRTGTLSDHVGCFVLSPGERTAGDEIELRAQCISSGSWTRVFRLEPGLTEVVVGLECREIPADDVSENH
ncbi:MAG: carboxypeptidase-like regulatory domain-containing protein, partial [Gemmatimonadota bacterium]|nr:carboxypeptidase-like regulatory domain-containing protein [Gemmatimonadota bacterium]